MLTPPPRSTLFPYTTLFRSSGKPGKAHIPVVAGQTVQLFWNTWPPGHSGPVIDYLASCANNDCSTRSEEHTSELQSPCNLVCRLLLEKKKTKKNTNITTTNN